MWGVVSGFQESSCAFVEEEHSCGGPEIRWWNTVLIIPCALVAWLQELHTMVQYVVVGGGMW